LKFLENLEEMPDAEPACTGPPCVTFVLYRAGPIIILNKINE